MITAYRTKTVVRSDGRIEVDVPELKPGEQAEVIVLVEAKTKKPSLQTMTAARLLSSGLVGIWADRKDIADSQEFARQLRKSAEDRNKIE